MENMLDVGMGIPSRESFGKGSGREFFWGRSVTCWIETGLRTLSKESGCAVMVLYCYYLVVLDMAGPWMGQVPGTLQGVVSMDDRSVKGAPEEGPVVRLG